MLEKKPATVFNVYDCQILAGYFQILAAARHWVHSLFDTGCHGFPNLP